MMSLEIVANRQPYLIVLRRLQRSSGGRELSGTSHSLDLSDQGVFLVGEDDSPKKLQNETEQTQRSCFGASYLSRATSLR